MPCCLTDVRNRSYMLCVKCAWLLPGDGLVLKMPWCQRGYSYVENGLEDGTSRSVHSFPPLWMMAECCLWPSPMQENWHLLQLLYWLRPHQVFWFRSLVKNQKDVNHLADTEQSIQMLPRRAQRWVTFSSVEACPQMRTSDWTGPLLVLVLTFSGYWWWFWRVRQWQQREQLTPVLHRWRSGLENYSDGGFCDEPLLYWLRHRSSCLRWNLSP